MSDKTTTGNKRRNFRLTFGLSAVLLALTAFYLISVLDNLRGARIDLTSDRLFTMSPAAKKILEGLEVPVQVKLFITPSEKMPTQLRNLERDVTEQMRNFEQVADGMLEFAVFNPQDDEELQQTLAGKGINPFQVQSIEKDEMGIKLIWSAITIAYKDKPEEILPRVLPQNLAALEQDIIGPVYRLTRDTTPKVAIFAPPKPVDQQLAMMYLQQGMQPPAPQDMYARLPELLQQGHYEAVRVELTPDSLVPEDAALLIVMATGPMNERQVYEIGRVMRRGTPVIMAVQPHEYGYNPAQQGGWSITGMDVDSGLEPLLATYGLTVSKDHLMDEAMETIDLPRDINLGGIRMQTREPVRVPIQIRVTESQMDQDSPLVNRIGSLFYLWGGAVETDRAVTDSLGLEARDLIFSSDNTWTLPWTPGPLTAAMINPAGQDMVGPRPLGVLVTGQFPEFGPETGPPAWPADQAAAADSAGLVGPRADEAPVTPAPGQLFLIGSAKMFDDNVISAPQNGLLMLNAIDYLAGSQDLLSIRSKILTQRVIKPVDANGKMLWRIFVVLLVPVVLAVFGVMRAGMRRKEAAQYRAALRRASGGGM